MPAGKKRNAQALTKSPVPSKRAKTAGNAKIKSSDDGSKSASPRKPFWPSKQTLSPEQLAQLLQPLNPSLHRHVFDAWHKKNKLGERKFKMHMSYSRQHRKQKLYDGMLMLTNKHDPQQKLVVESAQFTCKKRAEIATYREFNLTYIPFDRLCALMRPFSSSAGVSASQMAKRSGSHLKGKSQTVLLSPIPLECHEVDILELLRMPNHGSAQFMWFERASQRSIVKTVTIAFDSREMADAVVDVLNGRIWRHHKLRATWTDDRAYETKPTMWLKVVGFPVAVSDSNFGGPQHVRNFLSELRVDPARVTQVSRYNLSIQVFMDFDKLHESKAAFETLNKAKFELKESEEAGEAKKKFRLYARYSNGEEYAEAQEYVTDYQRAYAELVTRSTSVDVKNVPWDATEEKLETVFAAAGQVVSVHLWHDKHLLPGTALVTFETEKASEKAIRLLSGHPMNGCALAVSMHHKQTHEERKAMRIKHHLLRQQKLTEAKERRDARGEKKKANNRRNNIRKKRKRLLIREANREAAQEAREAKEQARFNADRDGEEYGEEPMSRWGTRKGKRRNRYIKTGVDWADQAL